MASCGICNDPTKKYYCHSCASYLLLQNRLSCLNSTNERSQLAATVDNILAGDLIYDRYEETTKGSKRRHIKLLTTKAEGLRRQIAVLKDSRRGVVSNLHRQKQQLQQLKQDNETKRNKIETLNRNLQGQYDAQKSSLVSDIATRHKQVDELGDKRQAARDRLLNDLAMVFGIRKRRKRDKNIRPESLPNVQPSIHRFDILLGFSVLPDLTKLVQFSAASTNMAIERLAVFVGLLANYLDLQLPYELALPTRTHPFIRMGSGGRGIKQSLNLEHSVASMAKEHPHELENYAQGLAMLSACLATVACYQRVYVSTIEQYTQVNQTVTRLYKTLVPKNNDRVPKSSTPEFGPSPANSVGDIDNHQIQLDAIRDYIVAQTYVEINGESAEWNLVDFESAAAAGGSLVELTGIEDSE